MFKAELFNATAWGELFRRSGARYTVPTSKHHEGFALWPSAQAWNWNAVDIGPHRDLLKEIMDATRAAGLHAGMYFSLYEWFNPFILSNLTKYIVEVMRPQWMDLIDNYRPDVFWCDGDWVADSDQWGTRQLLEYMYNDSPVKDTVVVDDRIGTDTSRKHGRTSADTQKHPNTDTERGDEERPFCFSAETTAPLSRLFLTLISSPLTFTPSVHSLFAFSLPFSLFSRLSFTYQATSTHPSTARRRTPTRNGRPAWVRHIHHVVQSHHDTS